MANFFLFLQIKPSFCRWSQLDFSAIHVSISAVSLTGRQLWQNENRNIAKNSKCTGRENTSEKKETSGCFCLCSFCFWGEVSNSWILNDIGRNFLLGSRKKIAKCLMRTFTCRSTFLYAVGLQNVLLFCCYLLGQPFAFCVCEKKKHGARSKNALCRFCWRP